MNNETKYWAFTWETNKKQKKLPDEEKLWLFLNNISEKCAFQYERGSKKGKLHIQGMFNLLGPRQSKTAILKRFSEDFSNVSGLTVSPVYDKLAIKAYVTKEEGRVKGPFYGGSEEKFDFQMAKAKLRMWQKQLYDIMTSEEAEMLRDRKVIWVQDLSGNTGKSWFQKWLRTGQRKLTVRGLPISSVDRLMSAVYILNKKTKVDAYTIDFTRTRGEDQSFNDLFSSLEQIKNGRVIDVMYGKYHEAIFDPPMVLIFTNEKFDDFEKYLSKDRWLRFCISRNDGLMEITYSSDTKGDVYIPRKYQEENNSPGKEDPGLNSKDANAN